MTCQYCKKTIKRLAMSSFRSSVFVGLDIYYEHEWNNSLYCPENVINFEKRTGYANPALFNEYIKIL